MFAQRSALSVRSSLIAAALLTSSVLLVAAGPAIATDDLFEPLPEGYSPQPYSEPRVDVDSRSDSVDDDTDINDVSGAPSSGTDAGLFDQPTQVSPETAAADAPILNEPSQGPEIVQPATMPSADQPIGQGLQQADGDLFDVAPQPAGQTVEKQADPVAPKITQADAPKAGAKTGVVGEPSLSIFDLNAKQKLAAEGSSVGQPHPLALSYPDHFTVVCEAGCKERGIGIVYQERQDARGPINVPGVEVEKLPVEASKNVVVCVGGCYNGERVESLTADLGGYVGQPVPSETSWMSNEANPSASQTAPAPGKVDASKRWYDRIGG